MTDMWQPAIQNCNCKSNFSAVKIRVNNPKTVIDGSCNNGFCNNSGNNANGIDIEVNNPKVIYTNSIYAYRHAQRPVNYTTIYSNPTNIPVISVIPVIKKEKTPDENVQKKGAKKEIEIIPPVDIVPELNLQSIINNLQSEDCNIQAKEMENIIKTSIKGNEVLKPYLVQDIISSLADIAEKDTTSINDVQTREACEKNKVYALTSLAVLGKAYSELIEKENGNVVPLSEIPGVAVIIKNIKENPNPEMQTCAKDALKLLQRNEYQQEIDSLTK